MNRWTTTGVVLGLCGLAMTAELAGQDPPPTLVATQKVQQQEFHDQLTLVGRTRARADSAIVSEVEGRVEKVHAGEGRKVARGEPLLTIDSRRIALALRAKKAEAEQARAQAELAEKELVRAEELVQTSIFPIRNRDEAIAEAARSAARLAELEAETEELELDLRESVITMPFSGFTIRRRVDVGEWVTRGSAVFEAVDLSVIEVVLDLPERHFGSLELGSSVGVVVSGDENEPIEGRVSGIAPRASESTHTFPVIVEVPNAEMRLGGGMLVRASVRLAGTFESLAVPKDAILRQGDRTLVYTIDDGKAKPIPVTIAAREGSLVAISGDEISVDSEVVVRGNERLFPGSPVQVAP